mgnify:FL=1
MDVYTLAAIAEILPQDYQIPVQLREKVIRMIDEVLQTDKLRPTAEYLLCLKIMADRFGTKSTGLNYYLENQARLLESTKGGFGAVIGDKADIYSTYAVVRILSEMHLPFERARVDECVKQYKLDDGGFRCEEGAPIFDLSSTYYALLTIKLLGNGGGKGG